ncbi:thioredoxin domain-containing protein [Mycobacterium sp. 236(2023)]|uniref:DsbA family protein n=1 Tax=Mycobacterium sp. 236(2023) TaxID=3038163 RepID=UPI0024153E9C|nr:thioredoxin domain-containing protein [Mycobacterium sp. 236(2023)]MDG4663602.1 thioredoxin domain-containing protein [Mycobacterium sp. 236(2023)]
MRLIRPLLVISALALLVPAAGCSSQVTGVPVISSDTVPLAVTEDGFGIVAGFDDAPAKIEIFTEPQCSHCSDLQRDYGDDLAYNITVGALQVTYRPLTFLDEEDDGYSATVANAMFLATEAIDNSAATGTQFQRFVEELWFNQDYGGVPFSAEELSGMATTAGLPDLVANNVGDDKEAVDVIDMEDTNFGLLYDVDPIDTGTPTVYDLDAGEKLDIFDENWLSDLVTS